MKKRIVIIFLLALLLCGCKERKTVNMVKYCEQGILEDNKCKIVTTEKPKEIKCEDESFTFNEDSKKCEHIISIPANRRLGCKDEEKYVLKNGACYPKSGKGARKYKVNVYSCPDSGRLNKNKCEFVDERDPVVSCKEGFEVNISKAVCEKTEYEEPKEKAE